jgi:hypothetical protein
MRSKFVAATLLLSASLTYAKDLKAYQDAKLQAMASVPCAVDSKTASKSHDLLCQEYTLQSDQVTYTIRPVDEKHSPLLPVGSDAQFRLEKVTLLLRIPSFDGKERKFSVVAVKPRGESAADAAPTRVNHLQ